MFDPQRPYAMKTHALRVITAEPLASSGTATSSAIAKLDDALDLARDLIADGVEVLRIEDAAGAVVRDADAVKAWCAARPTSTKPHL